MKPQELRIGNYVYGASDRLEIIVAISSESIYTDHYLPEKLSAPFECKISDIKPIPITEEWLMKFGFSAGYDTKLGYEESFSIDEFILDTDFCLSIAQEDNKITIRSEIKHIHQLQNIYHSLTGEELTIKE